MAAESAWKLGGLTKMELGKRVWGQVTEDEILDRSAALSYYFMFALFPMMLFLFAMLGMAAGPGTQLRQSVIEYLGKVLPGSASGLVQQVVDQTTKAAGGGKLSFGILAALWSAAAGVVGLMSSLNAVYEVREGRPFWKVRAIAIGLTLALAILVVVALGLILFGGKIADYVGNMIHMGKAFTVAWLVVQWPVIIAALLLAFAIVYYFAPDVEQRKWYWVTPGAVVGLVLWLVASVAFKVYLSFSNTYSATYGSVGAVIILMLWLYVTGLSLLMGGEINSEIENAAAERGEPTAKRAGAKLSQEREGTRGRQPSRPREKRPAA